MSDVELPDSLADLFDDDLLDELSDALGPPEEERAEGRFEVEVELDGKAYCLRYRDGVLTGKKGFARGDPLVSAKVPSGADAFLLGLLQAALDGYPDAPALAQRQKGARSLSQDQLQAVLDGVEKLNDMGLDLDVTGVGTFHMAIGVLDEVTRKVTAKVAQADVEAVLGGAPLSSMNSKVAIGGQKGLVTEFITALGPAWSVLKP